MNKINNLFVNIPKCIANIPKYKDNNFLMINLVLNLAFMIYASVYLLFFSHNLITGSCALICTLIIGTIVTFIKFCDEKDVANYFKKPRVVSFDCQSLAVYAFALNIILVITFGTCLL